jgi:hypothetical protein
VSKNCVTFRVTQRKLKHTQFSIADISSSADLVCICTTSAQQSTPFLFLISRVSEPRLDPYVAFSVPSMGNPGLSCLGVFELAPQSGPFVAIPVLYSEYFRRIVSRVSLASFWRVRTPNTIKYIFVFKEGINTGSQFRLKNTVLTNARNIRSAQDGPGSTFLSDPLSCDTRLFAPRELFSSSPRSSINPKTQQKKRFREREPEICS